MVDKNEAIRELARRELARREAGRTAEQVEAGQALQAIQPAQEPDGYSGSILPFSKDAQGNVSFDSDAGIMGAIKDAFMLPGDAMAGKVDPLSDEGIARSLGFAATFSPVTPGLRSGDMIIPGEKQSLKKGTPTVPTADQLYDEAAKNFEAMRNTGVDYASAAVKDAATAMKLRLEEQGFDAEVAGKTHRILDKLSSPPEGSVANIKGIHSARKTFGKIAQNYSDPTDQAAATQAIRGLDEFIETAGPSSVVAGTPSDVARLLAAGNSNFSAARRSDMLTGVERAADLRASATNSGHNTGNAIRQRVANALISDKAVSGFSPEELKALEGIVKGTRAQNISREIGNRLGGGGGLGQTALSAIGAASGAAAGGGIGAAFGAALPIAAGSGSRSVSNSLTRKALSEADEMVRMRSDLYRYLLGNAPMEVNRRAGSEAVIRALVASQAQGGGGGW